MAEADWNSMVKPPADETYETYDKESYDAKLYEWRRLAKDQQAETIGLRASLLRIVLTLVSNCIAGL